MALISCPECQREVSDQAGACPHCGYPIASSSCNPAPNEAGSDPAAVGQVQSDPERSVQKADTPHNVSTRRLVLIAVFVVIAIVIIVLKTSGVFAKNVGLGGLYNTNLGVKVTLGQSKSSLDSALGSPELQFEEYRYSDGLYVEFVDGKVISLYVEYPIDEWVTKSGVTNGMAAEELKNLLGEPASIEYNGKWWYYSNGPACVAGFYVSGKQITKVYIYNPEYS